ncbi:helix-turn-helix transcriptional regulator [bacterium]|jgi:hypothetical protein|nr:helix-turn-helix transcriptional regulator [bacterium]
MNKKYASKNVPSISMLENMNLGLCIKNETLITHQNEKSKELCGDRTNEICKKCTDKITPKSSKLGLKVRYRIFDNDVRIIINHNEKNENVTFLTPVDSFLSKTILNFLKTPGLTKQETEILKLICEGYTNEEILTLTFISKSTLKTHINHLNHKVKELSSFRKKHLN